MSNSRKRSRGNVEQVRTLVVVAQYGLNEHSQQGPGGSALTGWDFIQEKVLSHDEDMIADHADDIDTLLVFVSAVVIHETQLTSISWSGRSFLCRPHRLQYRVVQTSTTGPNGDLRDVARADFFAASW